ncbi:DUF1963 domain-containing protein [Nocardia sp. NPDC055321]
MDQLDLDALLREHIPPRLHADYHRAVRRAILLRKARDGDEVVGWLGGVPLLSAGQEWPSDEGYFLEHVATIDLAKLPTIDLNLPTTGTIAIFHDGESGMLRHVPAEENSYEATPPQSLIDDKGLYERVPLAYSVVPTLPTAYEMPLPELDFRDECYDEQLFEAVERFDEAWRAGDQPLHQIGGWASEIQGRNDRGVLPGSEAEQHFYADRDKPCGPLLLIQIDSEYTNDMVFADCGKLYCFIDPDDLAVGDLEAAQVYSESH